MKLTTQKAHKKKIYKDNVLDHRVLIEFLVGGKTWKFFPGTIKEVKMRRDGNRGLRCIHYVEFDDGDKLWFDLGHMESIQGLKWPREKGRKRATRKIKTDSIQEEEDEVSITPPAQSYDSDFTDATVEMETPSPSSVQLDRSHRVNEGNFKREPAETAPKTPPLQSYDSDSSDATVEMITPPP